MAGVGPPPKDPSKRARRNKEVAQLRVVEVESAAQPELPEFEQSVKVGDEFEMVGFKWPAATRAWWAMLDMHPLKGEFTELDWSYLLDTALIHAQMWQGDIKLASEIRLREAKYGFTPEDRARLRIQFAQATSEEVTAATSVQSARRRFGGMTVANELEA